MQGWQGGSGPAGTDRARPQDASGHQRVIWTSWEEAPSPSSPSVSQVCTGGADGSGPGPGCPRLEGQQTEAEGLHTGSGWVLLTVQGAGLDQQTDQSQAHMVSRKGGGCTGWAGVATSRRSSMIGKRVRQRQRGCSGERGWAQRLRCSPKCPCEAPPGSPQPGLREAGPSERRWGEAGSQAAGGDGTGHVLMTGAGVGVLQVLQQASSRCSRENPLPILTQAPEGQHTAGRLGGRCGAV